MLLTKAGYVESNPGPTKHTHTVWICDLCSKQIYTRKQTSIRCNTKDHWVHVYNISNLTSQNHIIPHGNQFNYHMDKSTHTRPQTLYQFNHHTDNMHPTKHQSHTPINNRETTFLKDGVYVKNNYFFHHLCINNIL